MNKTILSVLIILIAIVGVFYLLPSRDLSEQEMVRRALAGNGSATCIFMDPESEQEGTMYIKNGNMRISVRVDTAMENEEPMMTTAHMIMRGDDMHVWADGEPQGMHFSLMEMRDAEAIETPLLDFENEEVFQREYEEYQFSCNTSRVADESFVPPTDIEFVNFSTMMDMPQIEMPDFENMSEEEINEMMMQFEGMMPQQ